MVRTYFLIKVRKSPDVLVLLWIVSFIGLATQTYRLPVEWTVGDELLRHTLGAVSHSPIRI
jgi:hypothetical protein